MLAAVSERFVPNFQSLMAHKLSRLRMPNKDTIVPGGTTLPRIDGRESDADARAGGRTLSVGVARERQLRALRDAIDIDGANAVWLAVSTGKPALIWRFIACGVSPTQRAQNPEISPLQLAYDRNQPDSIRALAKACLAYGKNLDVHEIDTGGQNLEKRNKLAFAALKEAQALFNAANEVRAGSPASAVVTSGRASSQLAARHPVAPTPHEAAGRG
jgi:hypothetical protein